MSQISKAASKLTSRKRNPHRDGKPIRGRGKKTENSPEPKPVKVAPADQQCKIFFKSGNSTMLLCKGMTRLAGENLTLYIERFCRKHGSKIEGAFIFTK